jgi:hypothetical protein
MRTSNILLLLVVMALLVGCAGKPIVVLDAFGCTRDEAIPVRNYMAVYSIALSPDDASVPKTEAAAFEALPDCAKDDLALVHGVFQKGVSEMIAWEKNSGCLPISEGSLVCNNYALPVGTWNAAVAMLGKMVVMYGK